MTPYPPDETTQKGVVPISLVQPHILLYRGRGPSSELQSLGWFVYGALDLVWFPFPYWEAEA